MIRLAHLGTLTVIIVDRTLAVIEPDGTRHTIDVPCYGGDSDLAVFAHKPGIRLMLGTFPAGERVVYLYDTHDGDFGYAFNLDWPDGSEWGYAPVEDREAA